MQSLLPILLLMFSAQAFASDSSSAIMWMALAFSFLLNVIFSQMIPLLVRFVFLKRQVSILWTWLLVVMNVVFIVVVQIVAETEVRPTALIFSVFLSFFLLRAKTRGKDATVASSSRGFSKLGSLFSLSGSENDESYAAAWKEVKNTSVDEGLWARLFSENKGNEAKTTAAYLKTRVQQSGGEQKKEEKLRARQEKKLRARQEKEDKKVEKERVKEERKRTEHRLAVKIFWWMVALVIVGFVILNH